MYQILKKQKLAGDIYLMQIKAPDIAKKAKAGQFIILQIDEIGERIPMSISDFDSKSITVIFAVVGRTTKELAKLKKGNSLLHFTGPLGNPTEVMQFGNVCLVGGGFGIAPIYPIAREMKKAGNNVTIIAGAKSKKNLFWEDMLKKVSKELVICTDDGSKGRKGTTTDVLQDIMKRAKFDLVYAVGPLEMMRAVSKTTYQRARTVVSLNSIMLDGTGMCGSCRVRAAGEVKFSCVDGPDFNGHAVEWKSLVKRNKRYDEEEKHACRCGK
jgi:ferredoxin--NADP+ reductase